MVLFQMDQRFEATDETRLQLKFLEELDKLEKKRHEDSEREILLRAAKVSHRSIPHWASWLYLTSINKAFTFAAHLAYGGYR
jgi:hypothetical protein